jgi:hypothetical protein
MTGGLPLTYHRHAIVAVWRIKATTNNRQACAPLDSFRNTECTRYRMKLRK